MPRQEGQKHHRRTEMNATTAIRSRSILAAGAMSLTLAAFALSSPGTAHAERGEWFIADSFSFGVEHDMNAGAPAAQTSSRTFSFTLELLVENSAQGSPGPAQPAADPTPTCYLKYELAR
jgi:hypothetical protein